MFNFLKSNSPESTMRVSLFLVVLSVVFVMCSVGIYILKRSGCDTTEIANWASMGVFLGGVATIVTGMAWQKVQQKKIENKEPSDKEIKE